MQLNFFETACTGSHVAIGHWKYNNLLQHTDFQLTDSH
jgi:hypothetical protein